MAAAATGHALIAAWHGVAWRGVACGQENTPLCTQPWRMHGAVVETFSQVEAYASNRIPCGDRDPRRRRGRTYHYTTASNPYAMPQSQCKDCRVHGGRHHHHRRRLLGGAEEEEEEEGCPSFLSVVAWRRPDGAPPPTTAAQHQHTTFLPSTPPPPPPSPSPSTPPLRTPYLDTSSSVILI
jgi:hypothetical protein